MNKSNELDVLSQLGKRISYIRKKKGFSQLSLSIDAEISKSYLSDLELGKRNPTVTTLNKICLVLGITLEDLFKGISDVSYLYDDLANL